MEQISLNRVTFRYPSAETPALKDLSLNVSKGEFMVICGRSGCGKTTLLRLMKPQLAPCGELSGGITFCGVPLSTLPERDSAVKIGFVMQSPEDQIVSDKVWRELVFGLESLGLDTQTIRRRAAETASFFGIQNWFHKDVSRLSGGQKQLLCLAAVMSTQPELLILDEPTSRLDPIAAAEFLSTLQKINRELGTTVILAAHDLGEVLPLCTRAALLENGAITRVGSAAEICGALEDAGMFSALPAAAKIGRLLSPEEDCPVSVNEGRELLAKLAEKTAPRETPEKTPRSFGREAITARGVFFRYDKTSPDILRNASLSARAGELVCVLGGNGTGKTTLLKILAGLKKPHRGEVRANGRVLMLPQEPKTLFSKKTVYGELDEMFSEKKLPESEKQASISEITELCGLRGLEKRHPYDLSGGEQQRAALAKLLLAKPDVLLADEPTKGLDAEFKAELAAIFRALADNGVCVVIASHDAEFCAEYADRCALFFDGATAAEAPPREFFSGNAFYTTAAHRISRGIVPKAVTAGEVAAAFGKELPELSNRPQINGKTPQTEPQTVPPKPKKRTLSKRTAAALAADMLLIPLTLWASLAFIPRGQHYLVSTAVLIECMLPFFIVFEGRRPKARELVLTAVLSALAIAGRAAFFMLPQFKPVLAVVIISGAALGGEAGFLVGAVSMLVSNIMFSQGPWTPWQMFAAGIVGFFAGIIFRAGAARKRLPLCIFGAISAVALYGGIMNLSSALLALGGELTWGTLWVYIISGLPMDAVHGAATALFLWFLAKPMLEKLERVMVKFGKD